MDAVGFAGTASGRGGWGRGVALLALPGLLSAVLLTLAFPGPGLWWLAWAALVPLYAALVRPTPPGAAKSEGFRAFATGFFFGLFLHLIGMYWMFLIGGVPWAVLSVIEAGWFGLFGLLCAVLMPRVPPAARPWLFAALWTLLEYARSTGRLAFPWFLLAATQARQESLPLVQVVELTGQWGLTFAIAAVNGLLVEAWRAPTRGRKAVYAAAAAAVPLALAAYGIEYGLGTSTIKGEADEFELRKVAVVQGNVQKAPRYSEEARVAALRTYEDLTREAVAKYDPDFVLWPETVVPGYLLQEPWLYAAVSSLAKEVGTDLLVGATDADFILKERRNGTFHFDGRGLERNRYFKQRLVPMGEFLLLRDLLWPIYEKYGGFEMDFVPGTLPGVFPVGGYGAGRADIGMLICYESAFPAIERERTRGGAKVLVQMTSDQTFDGTSNPQQHADLAVLRAVENRRWFVRAGSTGLSQIIDAAGRVREGLPSGVAGTIGGMVPLRTDTTLYVRWGDWFVGACAAATLILPALPLRRRRSSAVPGAGTDASGPGGRSGRTSPSATAP